MSPDSRRFVGLGAGLAALLTLLAVPKALVLDEESYLWLGKQVFEHGAYGWSRLWPPWDGDAFVYAHPPLFLYWVGMWERATELVPLLRVGVGLPWSLVLGASAAWLALRSTRHPGLGLGLWICTPIVALGLQNSLMIDLPATALMALTVAAWREGAEEGKLHWFLLSGLALGLGLCTKYPVGLLLPVLGLHAWRQSRQGVGAGPWLGLGVGLSIFFAMEAALYFSYSKIHLMEVWLRRGEIPQGSMAGRGFGTLVRAGLLCLPLPFLQADRKAVVAGLVLAIGGLALLRPELPGLAAGLLLVFYAGAGGALFLRGLGRLFSGPGRRRKGDRDDALLLGGWLVTGMLGVVLFHNFAAPRYLFPVALPAALLVARAAEDVEGGKGLARLSMVLGALLAILLSVADARFAAASVEVAQRVLPLAKEGYFEGEWGLRSVLEGGGWKHRRPGEKLPSGALLAVADNAASDRQGLEALEPLRRLESVDSFSVRVVDVEVGIGFYAETLGILPFGVGRGPLEGVTVYRAP